MKKLIYILAFALVFTGSMATPQTASAATCPFVDDANSYVVNFPAKTLFSNQGAGNSEVTATANIPAGKYDIKLHTFDDHSAHGGQGQTNERYFVKLTKQDGTVFQSNPTDDIPETADTVTTLVNSNVNITSPITSIKAVHFGYPGTGNYQSLTPTCIKFIKVDTAPTLSATCTISKTNPNINEDVVYTVNPTGGNNPYTYSWTGAFTATTRTFTKSYPTAGTYTSNVTVRDSDGQNFSLSCPSVVVNSTPVNPTLDGSCSITPSVVQINQEVVFTAYPTGGNGSYTYSWNGSDGILNSSNSFSGRFGSAGVKYANVVISSNGQSITRSCNVTVQESYPTYSNLDGSCYGTPSNASASQGVTWYANVSGGNGYYIYSWSGSENLSGFGSPVYKTYQYGGTKYTTVTITSGNQTITRSCTVNVQDTNNNNNNLSLYCTANPTQATVGQNVQWMAYASGGNGYYTYSWNGTDGLSYGNSQGIQKSYTTSGTKTANVTVYDNNGRSQTATCSMNVTGGNVGGVTVIRDTNTGTPISGVYLSQVPATGISANMKVVLFALGILIWSLAIGYYISSKRKHAFAPTTGTIKDKVLAFKEANMKRGK